MRMPGLMAVLADIDYMMPDFLSLHNRPAIPCALFILHRLKVSP